MLNRIVWIPVLATAAILLVSCSEDDSNGRTGSFTDARDGRVYATVKIGHQVWMAENLNYRPDSGSWYYNDDSAAYAAAYGRLYDWNAAMSAAPAGWHLPGYAEWTTLLHDLGESDSAAYIQMIPGGSSGFNAMSGGWRDGNGNFSHLDAYAVFWSSSEGANDLADGCGMGINGQLTARIYYVIKGYGISVRCVKD